MYREKMLSSLKAGEITELQQKYLKQEFIKELDGLEFILCESRKESLLFRHRVHQDLYLTLGIDQEVGVEKDALNTLSWGEWEIKDSSGMAVDLNSENEMGKHKSTCSGFWLEGLESIPGFIALYGQQKQ